MGLLPRGYGKVGLLLTMSESADDATFKATLDSVALPKGSPVIGFTGTGGQEIKSIG